MKRSQGNDSTTHVPFKMARWLCWWQNQVIIGILSLVWGQGHAQAPTLSFQYLSLQQGLSANHGMAITQDTAGFMWIGTANGLTRFDGLRCLTFTHQIGNPRSLSHRIIRSVFTAHTGTLWVGAQEGLNRFEPATQSFQRYSFADVGPGCNFIRTIVDSPDGQLWVGTNGGVINLDPATGKISELHLPFRTTLLSANKTVRRLLVTGNTLWIGAESGLFAYNLATKQTRSFQCPAWELTSAPDNYISALACHPRTGDILVGTNHGKLTNLNPATGSLRELRPRTANQPVTSILFSRKGELWIGVHARGIQYYDVATNLFISYQNNENNPRSLISNSVRGIFEDRAGVIWIVTDDMGVCWANPTVNKFHSLFDDVGYRPLNTEGFNAAALSIGLDNTVWVATRDGLASINPQTRAYQLYHHDPHNVHSLDNNLTFAVRDDKQGSVWVGTVSGFNRLDKVTGRIDRIPGFAVPGEWAGKPDRTDKLRKGIAGNQVFSLLNAPDGRLFIGTNEKLAIYDPQTGHFAHQLNDERIQKLPGKNYNTLYVDHQQNLWVGGLGPIYKISPDLRLLASYVHNDNDPQSLPDEGVTDFAEDRFGRLWLSTDNGLACLDQQTKKFSLFTTRQGLPHNDTSALLMIGDTLWISTSRGLAYMDVRQLKITIFDETDGISSAEFESGSVARDSTGRLYFGAVHGLVYTQPNQIRLNSYVPPVYLTSFRANTKELLRDQSAAPAGLTLRHTQNMFTFEMAALSYDNPADNQYAYQLENFEDTWNQDGNRPFASYTNVPPGNYVLHVIAANNDGVWNRTGYRLPITILAPFWQTWWFRILALSALVTLTAFVARWREKRLANEQREKSALRERIALSEMKALRSQMNPHFLYNSLNAIRLFVLQNDSDNADRYLIKFARLMRLILDNSRQEWVTLASELDQLSLYLELEQLRFDHQFDFLITIVPTLSVEKTSIPPMIIQPYIENAILHGLAHKTSRGHILIRIERKDTHLECTVDDDGVGRQRAKALKNSSSTHQSVGLRVTEDRLQLIGQRSGQAAGVTIVDKYADNQQDTGTRVIIQLPFLDE